MGSNAESRTLNADGRAQQGRARCPSRPWTWHWILLAVLAVAGCSSAPTPDPPSQATPPIASVPDETAQPREGRAGSANPAFDQRSSDPWQVDLERDERRGGHTIARHVGRTDAQLQARLRRESIAAASTYVDLASAERIITRALGENSQRVQTWMARRSTRPNLAIRYRARDRLPTGRVLRRGERESTDAFGAVVVLRWRDDGWYVLTSYPEDLR
jgi:hypothetical protein